MTHRQDRPAWTLLGAWTLSLAIGCGGAGSTATGAGTSMPADTAPADSTAGDTAAADDTQADAWTADTADAGAGAGSDAGTDAGQDVATDAAAADQSAVVDSVQTDVAAEPDGAPGACAYTCDLKCVCKKDKQGCDVPECESGACMTLLGQISALKPGLQKCTAAVGCQNFEFPICNSAGCFQLGVAKDAKLDDLNNLAGAAMKAQCSQFSCGCMPAPQPFCLGGQCRQCPPDCAGTCDEQQAAIVQLVASQAWCSSDADCTVLQTGLCPFAGLPCGGVPLNKYAQTGQLQALLSAYAVPCNVAMCKCAVPGPALCVAGKCAIQ